MRFWVGLRTSEKNPKVMYMFGFCFWPIPSIFIRAILVKFKIFLWETDKLKKFSVNKKFESFRIFSIHPQVYVKPKLTDQMLFFKNRSMKEKYSFFQKKCSNLVEISAFFSKNRGIGQNHQKFWKNRQARPGKILFCVKKYQKGV